MEKINPPKINSRRADSKPMHLFHRVAVLMTMAGAGGSIGFTIYAGRHNSSIVLIVLFAGWVLSPFITLLLVNTLATRWSVGQRLSLYFLMVFITLASLFVYSGLWSPPDARPAFVFLIIPLLSWFFIGTAFLIAATLPNKD